MPTTIITGGTGGIATATAVRLLTDDPSRHIALIDIPGATVPDELQGFADRVLLLEGDVSSSDSVDPQARRIQELLPPVDGLVNAAGIVADNPSLELSTKDLDRMLSVHVTGTVLWSQAVARIMHTGAIVNLGSIGGLFGHPRRLPYSAAKGAVHSITRTLAVEWAHLGIRVNAVAPGIIETPLIQESRRLGLLDDRATSWAAMKRLGQPAEVAGPIAFLLGPSASYITGTILTVDGGFSALKIE